MKKLDIQVSEATMRKIREAADRWGMTVSAYLLSLHEKAMRRAQS
jgi:hypothetical protein